MRAGLALLLCLALAGCNLLWAGNPTRTHDIGVGISSAPPPPEMAETARASYTCDDGSSFDVTFDNAANTATVQEKGAAVVLALAVSGSGFRYADTTHELAGKADDAMWTVAAKTRHCTTKS